MVKARKTTATVIRDNLMDVLVKIESKRVNFPFSEKLITLCL